MKKILCLLAVLALGFVFPASAEETAGPVTAAELEALAESVRATALTGAPLNDPASEDAGSEDGTCFVYEIARIYAEGTELTAETPVSTLVFSGGEGAVFRHTGIDTAVADVLASFPLDNPELAGVREEAVLYLRENADGGYTYGRILRDGQRITAVEYGEVLPEGDAFRRVTVTYNMYSVLVDSIRVDGLNADAGYLDAEDAEELKAELQELLTHDEYQAVKSSRNGLDLDVFSEDDLIFDGFSYLAMQPATLPGETEQELIDNEDGTWLMRCDGDGYEAVFNCDEYGSNARILSFQILDEDTEGPRCVRLGDLFSEDFCRFRNGENETGEDMTELLYGTADTVPRGVATYDPAEMSLRYVTETASGEQVELILRYETNILDEIILHTLQ